MMREAKRKRLEAKGWKIGGVKSWLITREVIVPPSMAARSIRFPLVKPIVSSPKRTWT